MLKAIALATTILLGLASLASSQIEYDSVRVAVADGVTCPSSWTASTETVTLPTIYRVVGACVNRWPRLPCLVALRQ